MENSDQPVEEQPEKKHSDDQQQASPSQEQLSQQEAIRQGLIYPPPPSFYDQPPEATPPANQPASTGQPAQPSRTAGAESPVFNQWQPPIAPQPPVPPAGYPRFPQGAQTHLPMQGQGRKPKRSGWFWALWIVFTLVILSSCGVCAWGFSSYYTAAAPQLESSGNGINVINDYYDALQNQDYAQAYSDTALQGAQAGITQSKFTQAAQAADASYGRIQRYTSQNIQIQSGNSVSDLHFSVDVNVVRQHKSYTTHLTLGMVDQHWKILTYNQI